MDYEATIGLEVHAQLRCEAKLFCACPTGFGAAPNTHVCPVCLGHPGVLPVVNRRAVELAVRTALAVGATVHPVSVFARKNYFYPDLPKNYQITQYEHPLSEGGRIILWGVDGPREIGVTRIHLEEDAGKSKHPEADGSTSSRIDLNRCGIPLIEIVSRPQIHHPEDAHAYLTTLRQLLVWLDVCDGNMEEGSLRCDANVSLRPLGEERLGTRTELKNLNSFRFVAKALHFEIARQRVILESGKSVEQETLLWDETHNRTRVMRGKEEEHDYRYFPEPDLPPLVLSEGWIESVRRAIPELPEGRRERFCREFGLEEADARVLTSTRSLADYFEKVVGAGVAPKTAASWVITELLGHLNELGLDVAEATIEPVELGALIDTVASGRLSRRQAKEILGEAVETGRDPMTIIADRVVTQISTASVLEGWVEVVLDANPAQVAAYLGGKKTLLHYFTGEVMKISKGTANPTRLATLLRERLEQRRKR